ncbi:MAG TPA: type II secretion system F family protein [Desulfitobacteriaceae bacterium]|nr:type II secretion system F family protein [Desulfitobacteriaceae bacterium]
MPLYNYLAKDFSGNRISGVLEADNIQGFYKALKERQLFCLEVSQKRQPVNINSLAYLGRSTSNKLKLKDLAIFCRQFNVLLLAGVTVIRALDVIYQQTESKNCRAVVLKVYEAVQKGDLLSEAMRKQGDAFPAILINMVESGEASGKLDLVLQKMAEHFDKERKLRTKLISAMIYPIILSAVAIFVVIILLTFVLPTFVSMFEASGVALPLPTRMLLGLSKFFSNFWYIILLGLAALIYGWNKYLKSDKGKLFWDGAKLKIPLFKTVTIKVICARLTRTLSTLLSSGIPLLNCMEITAKVLGNRVVADGLLEAKEDMSKGSSLSQAVRRVGIFPAMIYSMISIGEESGSLEEILEKTSVYYDEEVEVAIQRMLAFFEPLMIVIMAAVIGFIVVSIMLAMFRVYSTIG